MQYLLCIIIIKSIKSNTINYYTKFIIYYRDKLYIYFLYINYTI